MPYLFFFLLLPNLCNAQATIAALGRYSIDIITPDSLQQLGFEEDEQSYVKGTIALPCTHIRTFKSRMMTIDGISVENLSLAFYDNKLFKIICDCSPQLLDTFVSIHGRGTPTPAIRLSLCGNSKPMLLRGELWQREEYISYVVLARGYAMNCEMQENTQLIIASKRLLSLTSDCELKNTDLFAEEFEKGLTKSPK